MRSKLAAAVLAALSCFSGAAFAQDSDRAVRQALDSLHYQTGDIALSDAGATLHVQPGFKYLAHDDARKVLEDVWGNPPDDDIVGMLVPDNAALGTEHSWAVVVTFADDGYVSDEDASKVDYSQVLKDMQAATGDENAERKKAGYPEYSIVGWAQPPRYEASTKRIYWAKQLQVQGADDNTLNYDIRVLGREGYLSMNAVASMADMNLVQSGMQQVLPMAEFNAGHRYADYKPGTDKLAAYGLAALVGGGIAAKAGLFAKLGVILLAAKKLVIAGVVAVGAAVKKFFGGGKDKPGTVA
jgi:uncharacterized membrane-anchored protein